MFCTQRRAPHLWLGLALAALLASACARTVINPTNGGQSPLSPPRARGITAIADEYYKQFLVAWPLEGFFSGVPEANLDRMGDNSLAALAAWRAREDAWLVELRALATTDITPGRDQVTYSILREQLESAVAERVCGSELWRVSQMFGTQQLPPMLATLQPVTTSELRAKALARLREFGPYLDREIEALKEGIRKGVTAPAGNVRAVIEQVDDLLALPPERSPVLALVERAGTAPEWKPAVLDVLRSVVQPALARYRQYLSAEYVPRARQSTAIADIPRGVECYRARVRGFTTLDLEPAAVHRMGLEEGARIEAEMKTIARRAFKTEDLPALLQRLRTEPRYKFKSRQEVVQVADAALARVKQGLPRMFGRLPRAEMKLEPCQPFEEKSGCPNSYLPAAEDGSRPAQWRINTNPEHASRAALEAIAFHEGYPGHHLQIATAQELRDVHPITKLLSNSGYAEGWGLYAERLANELGAYSSDLAQLGRLSSAAWRAARLVVDPGLHVLGWSRDRAIDYLMTHTATSREGAASEVDRYIIWPGQATAYMVGRMEIERLRAEAEARLGPAFDLRSFHDRLLENGAVPLSFLRQRISAWNATTAAR